MRTKRCLTPLIYLGRGWKWNKEGYYEKRGKRKHFHPEEPGHGPDHWDIEDRRGNKIGKEFIPAPRVPMYLWIVPMLESYFDILMPSYTKEPPGPTA